MTVYDFSSGFNLLNQGINSLGEALNNRTNAQGYSGIGAAIQQGDWEGASSRAWAMGNPDLAMKLQMQGYAIRQAQAYGAGTDGTAAQPVSLQPTKTDDTTKAPTDTTQAPATMPRLAGGPGGTAPIVGKWAPPGGTPQDVANYIYQGALARGIDPVIALRVAKSEGLNAYAGDKGMSFGPFQLYTGGGLGNEFKAKTGLDPSDPTTWKQQVDFALDVAATKKSWGDWHGARAVGIPNDLGFDGAHPAGVSIAGPAGAALGSGSTQIPTAAPASRFAPGGFAGVGAPGAAAGAPGQPAAAPGAAPPVQPAPPPAPIPPAPTAALPAAQPAQPAAPAGPQPWQPGQGFAPRQAYAGIPLDAPEQGVDALARALATNLPGAPSPQQQATAAANPPGLGDLVRLLRGQPNAPAQAAPGVSPGANIPAAYGQPQPAPAAAPAGPAAQLQPIVQALQSGRITMRELLANPQAFGLPDPRSPQGQVVWQVLGQAATSTGRGAGQGPPTPAMGAQAFGGANATATSTGPAPLPPARPKDFGEPPPELSTAGPGFGEGQDPTSAIRAATADRGPGQPIVEAPLPPVRTADIGKPFPVKPPPSPPPPVVPAAIQPKSSRVATPQGPYGPPDTGARPSAFARDFGPGQGQMWGPSGGVMASGRGGITPDYLGGPTPQGVTPAAIAQARNAFMQPGPGTAPAALAGAPTRGGGGLGGALGGALSGLGGGLLNMLSMQPPQGVPGLPSPAQYLQGGQNAPVPAPPWARPPGQQGPGMFPTAAPGAQPAVTQPTTVAGAPGAPGQPAQPADALQAQIDNARYQAQRARAAALATSTFNPAMSKNFEDAANKYDELANNLIQKQAEAGIKPGEVEVTTTADMAKERSKELSSAYDKAVSPGGPIGLMKNVQQMKANLDGMVTGYGAAQPILEHIGNMLAGLTHDPGTMDRQMFTDLSNQEVLQLAQTLIGQQRLNRNEFEALRKGQLNTEQQKEVLSKLLDAAMERGGMALDQQNRSVENYKKAFPKYAGQADQFSVPDEIRPDKDAYKGPKPTGFSGGGAGGGAKVAAPPPIGFVKNGYRYQGGDASQPGSWVKVQ